MSYSHEDRKWIKTIETHLRPLTSRGVLSLWIDKKILPSEDWLQKIKEALASADAALLLATPSFVASDFINKKELPALLAKANKDGLPIFWLMVSACLYKRIGLARYQALNEPQRPLDKLNNADRNRVMTTAVEQMEQVLQEKHPKTKSGMGGKATPVRPCPRPEPVRAETGKTLVSGDKYKQDSLITRSRGVRIIEEWLHLVPFNASSVAEIPVSFSAQAGRQDPWKCKSLVDGQSVIWDWQQTAEGEYMGKYVFDPPVSKEHPASFRTERYIFNAVCFTQAERLLDSNGKEKHERHRWSFSQRWKTALIKLRFPEHRFPRQSYIDVEGEDQTVDAVEKDRAKDYFDKFPESQELVLALPAPKRFVKYAIKWELPEALSSPYTNMEQGFIEEITRRLLGLREGGGGSLILPKVLSGCRERLLRLAGGRTDEDLVTALYVYDRQKSVLVCVASVKSDQSEGDMAKFFKPGRGIVGLAFRNRAVEPYRYQKGGSDPDPWETFAWEFNRPRPAGVICVPLFYKEHHDRAMAVLSFESDSPSLELSNLIGASDAGARIEKAFENWFETDLAEAIGVHTSQRFWLVV